jgi:imidazoleglycerol phosphate dehydratase HisB
MTARTATISRKTNETQIEVSISLDRTPGSGQTQNIDISTGIGFLDHVAVPPYSDLVDRLIGFSRCIMR